MLAAFRAFAKSPWAIGLIALLIFGFALFGIKDAFKANIGTDVIRAGSRTVTAVEFKTAYDGYRKKLEQQYQQPIDADLAVKQGIDRQVMEGLAGETAFSALLSKLGLRAPSKLIDEQIRSIPAFFDPVTGQFDQKTFESVLAQNGLDPRMGGVETFKRTLSDELLAQQLSPGAAGGLRAPRAYATLGGALMLEQRDLAFFAIDPRTIPQPAMPTDAELNAFYKANAKPLPEFRAISIVRLSRKAMLPTVSIDQAEVEKRFAFEKDSLSTPETRTVVQIPVKDGAQSAAVTARLNKGESAAVVAGSLGIKPLTFADKPRSAFFDPGVRDAAFKLPAGGVAAIKGEFGLVVLKVETVTPGKEATLAEHRAAIEAKVRSDAADRKVTEASKTYEDAHAAGADMTAAAAKAGLPVITTPPVMAQGLGQDRKPVAGLSEAVMKAAFEAAPGIDSDILQDGEGEYFIVRVDKVVPSALPPMETVRPELVRALMMQRFGEAMKKKSDDLVARVRKGESIDAVAASIGASVQRLNGLSPITARQHEALGRDLLGGAFGVKKGEVFVAGGPNGSAIVATVTAIRPGDVQQIAQAANQQQGQFSKQLFDDLRGSIQSYARTALKTETNLRNARIAIGVDPTKAGDATGKPADAAPAKK